MGRTGFGHENRWASSPPWRPERKEKDPEGLQNWETWESTTLERYILGLSWGYVLYIYIWVWWYAWISCTFANKNHGENGEKRMDFHYLPSKGFAMTSLPTTAMASDPEIPDLHWEMTMNPGIRMRYEETKHSCIYHIHMLMYAININVHIIIYKCACMCNCWYIKFTERKICIMFSCSVQYRCLYMSMEKSSEITWTYNPETKVTNC